MPSIRGSGRIFICSKKVGGSMSDYDVVVIGTGTAGQSAAYELKANGLTVADEEKSRTPGGACALAG